MGLYSNDFPQPMYIEPLEGEGDIWNLERIKLPMNQCSPTSHSLKSSIVQITDSDR